MNRRDVVFQGSASLVALASASRLQAASVQQPTTSDGALIDAALDCAKAGEICSAHCTTLLEQGNRAIAECQRRVNETVSVCQALASLAAQG